MKITAVQVTKTKTIIFRLNFFIIFCLVPLFFLGFENDVFAASKADKAKPKTPAKIRSQLIDIKRKSQTVEFLGDAIVEKDDSSLLAEKMTVFYREKKQKPSKKKESKVKNIADKENLSSKEADGEIKKSTTIERIDAEVNVKIFSDELVGRGDFGYYDPNQNIFVLEKNVEINNGTSVAKGNKFIYNLTTKKGNFVGDNNEKSAEKKNIDRRVTVIIGDDMQDQKKEKNEDTKR